MTRKQISRCMIVWGEETNKGFRDSNSLDHFVWGILKVRLEDSQYTSVGAFWYSPIKEGNQLE